MSYLVCWYAYNSIMSQSQRISIKRLFIEATAIVVSILFAFAIDAWWEDRGDREAEQKLLKRLRADFVEIREAVVFNQQEHLEANSACIALLNLPDGEPLPHSFEVDRMVAVVFLTSRTFNPGSGAVAAFLNGEGARLIRSPELADRLLAWPGLVEELQEEDVFLQKGLAERWIPFLTSRVSIGPFLATYPNIMSDIPGQVANPVYRELLLADLTFKNMVMDRYKFQAIVLRDIEPLRIASEDILQLLDKEIRD